MSTLSQPGPAIVRGQNEAVDAEWQSWREHLHNQQLHNPHPTSLPWMEQQDRPLLSYSIWSLLPLQSPPRLPFPQASMFRPRTKLPDLETRDSSTPRLPTPQVTDQRGKEERQNDAASSEETFIPRDARETAHNQRTQELLDMLDPINSRGDNSSTILIACGEANESYVFPVKIPHGADDTQRWELIRDTYYAHRGKWRRRLPFFGVKQIGIAKVCYHAVRNFF